MGNKTYGYSKKDLACMQPIMSSAVRIFLAAWHVRCQKRTESRSASIGGGGGGRDGRGAGGGVPFPMSGCSELLRTPGWPKGCT